MDLLEERMRERMDTDGDAWDLWMLVIVCRGLGNLNDIGQDEPKVC